VHVLGGERLGQAAERQVRHRKARRLPADEQARHVELLEPRRHGKAGRAVGQVEIDEGDVRLVPFGGVDRGIRILGGGDDIISGVVLDQIFDRRGKLDVVLDD